MSGHIIHRMANKLTCFPRLLLYLSSILYVNLPLQLGLVTTCSAFGRLENSFFCIAIACGYVSFLGRKVVVLS